jgi:hypothetical protein
LVKYDNRCMYSMSFAMSVSIWKSVISTVLAKIELTRW